MRCCDASPTKQEVLHLDGEVHRFGWNDSDWFRLDVHRRKRMIKIGTANHRIPLMVKNATAIEAAQTDL